MHLPAAPTNGALDLLILNVFCPDISIGGLNNSETKTSSVKTGASLKTGATATGLFASAQLYPSNITAAVKTSQQQLKLR